MYRKKGGWGREGWQSKLYVWLQVGASSLTTCHRPFIGSVGRAGRVEKYTCTHTRANHVHCWNCHHGAPMPSPSGAETQLARRTRASCPPKQQQQHNCTHAAAWKQGTFGSTPLPIRVPKTTTENAKITCRLVATPTSPALDSRWTACPAVITTSSSTLACKGLLIQPLVHPD